MSKPDLIISISMFLIVLLCVVFSMKKAKNLKPYNFFIYGSLFLMWILVELTLKSKLQSKMNIWMQPVLLSLFQFSQVFARIPMGILSGKLKSRKNILSMLMLQFLIIWAISMSVNFATWSLILVVISAGIFGSSLGMQDQFWAENWDKKQAFYSIALVFTIPKLSDAFISMIPHTIDKPEFKSVLISFCAIAFIGTLMMTFYKEDPTTMQIDKTLQQPEIVDKNKVLKQLMPILISVAIISFATSLLSGLVFSAMFSSIFSRILNFVMPFALVALILIVNTYLIPLITGAGVRFIGISMMIIGMFTLLISVALKTNNKEVLIFSLILAMLGGVLLQTFLASVTLHADLKFPMLLLGIFLTIRSFSIGSATLLSGEIIKLNQSSGALIVVSIAFGFTLLSMASLFYYNSINLTEKTFIKYEFN